VGRDHAGVLGAGDPGPKDAQRHASLSSNHLIGAAGTESCMVARKRRFYQAPASLVAAACCQAAGWCKMWQRWASKRQERHPRTEFRKKNSSFMTQHYHCRRTCARRRHGGLPHPMQLRLENVDDDPLADTVVCDPCRLPYPCISDERYFPTVLAAAGLGNQTTCSGNGVHTDWGRPRAQTWSPFTYWMSVSRQFSRHFRLPARPRTRCMLSPAGSPPAVSAPSVPWPRALPYAITQFNECCLAGWCVNVKLTPCPLQDTNISAINTIRSQAGACPYESAMR